MCVMTSTTVSDSGAYLFTDVLLATTTVGSLYYLDHCRSAGRRRIRADRALSCTMDAFLASYQVARRNVASTNFYAGYAPSVELEEAGVTTHQVSWATLSGGPLGSILGCGDLLIFDKQQARVHAISLEQDRSVTLLLDDVRGEGQSVMRRTGCP
jgi:hypothetical protein